VNNSARVIYPYSVIPGGVESAAELRNSVAHDPVVAEHYGDFDIARARVVRLNQDRLLYVSYRLGNRVFWSKKRFTLHKGESVITDGEHMARTRCGNRLAEAPAAPIMAVEPELEAAPPATAETTIPQGVPCTRLANLILAPKEEAQRIAAYVPRWGMQLTANWSEAKAWAIYRMIQKQYAALIGDREPIVIRARGIGLGSAVRYNIRIADDDRWYLEKFCNQLIASGGACVVLRNDRG